MATIRDIAKQAGVSIATVSRALNNRVLVADETYQRIMSVMKQLEYEFTVKPQGSVTDNRLIITTCTDIDMLLTLQRMAAKVGYDVAAVPIGGTNDSQGYALQTINGLIKRYGNQFAGFILASIMLQPIPDLLQLLSGYPVVQMNMALDLPNMYLVQSDVEAAAHQLVCHMAAKGRKRIGLLTNDALCVHNLLWKRVLRGYRNGMMELGLEPQVYSLPISFEELVVLLKPLLTSKERPDAIISMGPDSTMACLELIRVRDIRIPEELMLADIGMGMSFLANKDDLTVIDMFDAEQLGVEAVRLLHEACSQPIYGNKTVSIPANITYRTSTGD
jgi:DNA-binding LacI/PurR family transcriptional regulator